MEKYTVNNEKFLHASAIFCSNKIISCNKEVEIEQNKKCLLTLLQIVTLHLFLFLCVRCLCRAI